MKSFSQRGGALALTGINPFLTGELLAQLDAIGHSDAVVIADAHFPAERLASGSHLLLSPGLTTPDVLRAIRTLIPLDDAPSVDLLNSADGVQLPVQDELIASARARVEDVQFLDRLAFHDVAEQAFLIARTGETRKCGNALVRKGVVRWEAPDAFENPADVSGRRRSPKR